MLNIRIEKTASPKAKPAKGAKLGFGHIFTDHMFVMNYDEGQGWHDARVVPFALPQWCSTTDRPCSRA